MPPIDLGSRIGTKWLEALGKDPHDVPDDMATSMSTKDQLGQVNPLMRVGFWPVPSLMDPCLDPMFLLFYCPNNYWHPLFVLIQDPIIFSC